MPGQEITVPTKDGEFMGYLSLPASGSGPGVVVIQEIFGVNSFMREIADWLADQGYAALSPDLFWRLEPGVQLNDGSEEDLQKAFDLYGRFDVDKGVEDIAATIAHLRTLAACSGQVGAVGFCLGGLLAYLTSTRTDCDAAVGYYGVSIDQKLDEAGRIGKPLLLHVAEKDQFVPPEAQKIVADRLADNAHAILHSYADVDHGFARAGGQHYDAAATKRAHERTLSFFARHLGSS